MRTLSVLTLLAVCPALSAADEEPREVIRRALTASGMTRFEAPIALRYAYRMKSGKGAAEEFQMECLGESDSPRFRLTVRQRTEVQVYVSDGRRMWLATNEDEGTKEVEEKERNSMLQLQHAERAIWLLPLLQDRKFKLARLADAVVEGRPVAGVKVSYPEQEDVRLYFDKASHFLLEADFNLPGVPRGPWAMKRAFRDHRLCDWGTPDVRRLCDAWLPTDDASLVKMVRDQVPDDRRAAEMGRLIEQLRSRSFKARKEATEALLRMGKAALPGLRRAANDPDYEVSRRAREVIDRLGPDPDFALVPVAARLLARRRLVGAEDVLAAFLEHCHDEPLRREISAALAAVAPRRVKEDILRQPGRRLFLPPLKVARHSVLRAEGESMTFSLELLELEAFNRHEDRYFARPRPPAK